MIIRHTSILWLAAMAFTICSCNTSSKKEQPITNKIQDTMAADTKEQDTPPSNGHPGIFFKASGNEPFWNVSMEEGKITFTSLIEGYEEIHTPLPEMHRAADANVKMYRVATEKVNLRIEILQGECADTMADKTYPYSVRVEIQLTGAEEPKSLQGCGTYLSDPRLNDIWVLEQLGPEPADPSWFNEKVPEMEINTTANTLMGFAGCNRMRGTIFWEPGLLRFTNIATTRMACQPGNREADFLKRLQSATRYRIENNRLWLSNPNGSLLVFKKVD